MMRSHPPVSQIRSNVTDDERDFRTMALMQDKMHDYRMSQIRDSLEDVRKKNWIYVGNAFRETPLAPSKP